MKIYNYIATAFITFYLILRYGLEGAHKVMDKKLEELREELINNQSNEGD